MCLAPDVPEPPPPPAQRQAMKQPEVKDLSGVDPMKRRRGYAALMRAPTLGMAQTTATLGG